MKIDVGQLRKWKVSLSTDVLGTMFQVIRIGNVAAEGQEYVTVDLLLSDGQISRNWHAIYIDANSIDLTEA